MMITLVVYFFMDGSSNHFPHVMSCVILNISAKANNSLNFLHRNINVRDHSIKGKAVLYPRVWPDFPITWFFDPISVEVVGGSTYVPERVQPPCKYIMCIVTEKLQPKGQ